MATRGRLTRQRLLVAAGLAAKGDARAVWQRLRLHSREPIRRSGERRAFSLPSRRGVGTASARAADPALPSILLVMPFVIGGGMERMLSSVAGALVVAGHRVVAVTTRSTPFGYGDRSEWFAEAGVDLFELPELLPEREWLDFLDWLIESEQVEVLWQTGSDWLYRALEELRRLHPQLRIVDSLFNADVHIGRHLSQRESIDLAIVESELVAQALERGGRERERLVRIPNGVDSSRFRPRGHVVTAEVVSKPSRFEVGFVGRLAGEKDPFAFVDLAAACRGLPMRFHVAGDGPLAGAVKRRVRRRRLRDSVLLHGFVEDIRELYDQLDVLVIPSRADGRPNVAMEALAMGLPVLASPVGALPRLIEEGVTGFVCTDVQAFAERLRWLQSHPDEHQGMRQAAREAAARDFDASATYRRYEQVLDELVQDRRRLRAAHG